MGCNFKESLILNGDWGSRQQMGNQKKSSWVPAFTPVYCLSPCWLSLTCSPWSCQHVFPIKVDCNSGQNNLLFIKLLISYIPKDWKKLLLVKCAENWAGWYDIIDLIFRVCFFFLLFLKSTGKLNCAHDIMEKLRRTNNDIDGNTHSAVKCISLKILKTVKVQCYKNYKLWLLQVSKSCAWVRLPSELQMGKKTGDRYLMSRFWTGFHEEQLSPWNVHVWSKDGFSLVVAVLSSSVR